MFFSQILDAAAKEFVTLESIADADKYKIVRMNCYADELDLNLNAVHAALEKLDAVRVELSSAGPSK